MTKDYTINELFQNQIPESFGTPNFYGDVPAFRNTYSGGSYVALGGGEMQGNTSMTSGYLQSEGFVSGSTGWQIDADGNVEFNSGTFRGTLTAGSIHIPDEDTTANSFHVESDGDTWWGTTQSLWTADNDNAVAYVLKTGAAKFKSVILSDSVKITDLASGTDISLLEATHNLVFSVTDADTIAWAGGTLTLSNGVSYTLDAGNTGNMAALTYIYLDPAVSTTVLQTTTTYSTAMGANKRLIGTAKNNTVTASYIPYGSGTPLIDGSDIGALSIVAGNIAASTITAGKMSVAQLSAIAADLGSITAGSITINSGVASINSSGDATFKSIQVGGSNRQYTIADSGLYTFGDGSDGDLTTSGNVTLTADAYYDDLTVTAGDTFNTAGYRIFVRGILTVSGTIARNGNNATGTAVNGSGATGGQGGTTGGAALADGYLKGSVAGKNGGNAGDGGVSGNPGVAASGTAVSNSIGANGAGGGTGGNSGGVPGGQANAGAATASNVRLIANWHLSTLLDIAASGSTVKFNNSAGSAGGGGGAGGENGGGTGGGGGEGGASGSSGGIVAIYAKEIIIEASGDISLTGGNGNNGGNGAAGSGGNASGGGGGGGGSGGNGGQLILVYNSFTNNGSITLTGGTAGSGGTGGTASGSGSPGNNGTNGSAGTTGTARQFQVSL